MRPAGTVGWRGIQSQVRTDRNTVLWEKPASQPSGHGALPERLSSRPDHSRDEEPEGLQCRDDTRSSWALPHASEQCPSWSIGAGAACGDCWEGPGQTD